MHKQILFCVLASIGVALLCGCGSDPNKPASTDEKKAFAGSQMPANARAKFEAQQQQNAQGIADAAAKGRAGATGGR